MRRTDGHYRCTMEATLDVIGGKWKGVILWHMRERTLRFNELTRLMPRVTPKMLTQQLRDLEADGLVLRTVYPVVPPKVEYTLTDVGRSLLPVLDVMCAWGKEYRERTGVSRTARANEGAGGPDVADTSPKAESEDEPGIRRPLITA